MNYSLQPYRLLLFLLLLIIWSCSQKEKKATSTPTEKVADSAQMTFVRPVAHSAEGAEQLKAMAVALEKMKSLPCENPISWYYQGAIHWVPDTVKNKNPLCPMYQSRMDTLKAWDNCTHVNGDANSDYQFLIWHRLYIWHFEKIIRSLSGKADFALPYWKYVSDKYRVMPDELRNGKSSLFTSGRLDSLNKGDAISDEFAKYSLTAATEEAYEAKTYMVFNSSIDKAPHGAMHDYIGGAWSQTPMFNEIYQAGPYTKTDTLYGWMSHVPSAGFDPVFWLHHANIDYLWNEWENGPNGERPSFEQMKKFPWSFTFPEPDGTFTTYTMSEAYERAFNPDYSYASASPLIAMDTEKHKKLTTGAQLTMPEGSEVAKLAAKKFIGKGTSVLALTGKLKSAFTDETTKGMLQNSQSGDFIIEIDVSFKKEPTGGFAVFINNTDDANAEGEFIGMMTFFGASHHGGMHKMMGKEDMKMSRKFLFDVTDELMKAGETPHLIFKKIGGNTTGVTIESIQINRY